jgi:hypothetical protein
MGIKYRLFYNNAVLRKYYLFSGLIGNLFVLRSGAVNMEGWRME